VPPEAAAHLGEAVRRGAAAHAEWRERFAAYKVAHAELARDLERAIANELPPGWDDNLPSFSGPIATRSASGKVMVALAQRIPWLVGGDADLGGSTKTIVGGGDYDRSGAGRNLRFGVREHGMGAIANGMLYHGATRPFVATFFVFSDYMRPPVRLAALNKQPAIYVWTHDSVGLGEDGPTHQPIEHLMSLRAMPGMVTFRPADANETLAGWRVALRRTNGPTALVLSRQDLPIIAPPGAPDAEKGAYVVVDGADVLLVATGSEVSVALAARELLAKDGIAARVVSMPSWELFREQSIDYRESVLPPGQRKRVSVEAGTTFGWREHVGDGGIAIGIDRFGASAPGEVLLEKLGITAKAVADAARRLL
jgi:transketolase